MRGFEDEIIFPRDIKIDETAKLPDLVPILPVRNTVLQQERYPSSGLHSQRRAVCRRNAGHDSGLPATRNCQGYPVSLCRSDCRGY